MSLHESFLAQLSVEVGTKIVLNDVIFLAAMLVIFVISNRILADTLEAVKQLVSPMVKHIQDARLAKDKALRIKMEIAARNEHEPMLR